jgi:predicted secreted hydrolase
MADLYESYFKPVESAAALLLHAAVDLFHGEAAVLRNSHEEARLPQDLYAHDDVQTEWWYYTGHCRTASGRQFGFEFVFFKRRTDQDVVGIVPIRAVANPMYFAHFAISDTYTRTFTYDHIRSFNGMFDLPVSMSETSYDLRLGDWSITEKDGAHVLHATLEPGIVFDAVLEMGKPLVHNGDGGNGISKKTNGASAHFSFTRMPVTGLITNGTTAEKFTGTAWMDREFGTWQQQDWDWFSIQFDNETELMIYQYRSGANAGSATGTFVDREGNCRYLKRDDYEIEVLSTWTSPRTGAEYPSLWHISVASLGLKLEVKPLIADQELDTRGTTMIVYWEGACSVAGTLHGNELTGKAYVELVGYDRSHEAAGIGEFLFADPIRRIVNFLS